MAPGWQKTLCYRSLPEQPHCEISSRHGYLADMRAANVNRHLFKLIANHARALEAGAIISVSEGHVRVRRLPL